MQVKAFGLALGLFISTVLTPIEAEAGLILQASRFVGLHERSDLSQLRRLLGINPARGPWCGDFVAAMVRRNGRNPPPGYRMAKSWVRYGQFVELRNAKAGDVVVMKFGRSYHVAIVLAVGNGFVRAIGGNQSNRVQVSNFNAGNIIAVRR